MLYSRCALKDDAPVASAKTVVFPEVRQGVMVVNFLPMLGVRNCDLWRADAPGGPFKIIIRHRPDSPIHDPSAITSRLYFYRVSPAGSELTSAAVGQMKRLPQGWTIRSQGVAKTRLQGPSFDGNTYRLYSNVPAQVVPFGPFCALERTSSANLTMVARVLPLVASHCIEVGLIVHGDAGYVRLLLSPNGRPTGDLRVGMFVASGIQGVGTEGSFDRVQVSQTAG